MSFVSLFLTAVLSQFNESEAEIVGASEDVVESPEEATIILERKSLRRETASTAINRNSSPSYGIL